MRKPNIGTLMAGANGNKARSENDFHPTPPEPTIALIDYYRGVIPRVVAELSCGQGHMARVIARQGFTVLASDKFHNGYGWGGVDFLELPEIPAWRRMALIQNPPFNQADEFIAHAHKLGFPFIAMFLKASFWNAAKRYELWEKHPPKAVHPIGWRVDFSGEGRPTMDTQWVVWGKDVPFSNEPFKRPE